MLDLTRFRGARWDDEVVLVVRLESPVNSDVDAAPMMDEEGAS